MAMPDSGAEIGTSCGGFRCPICSTAYGRVDHLQRHLDTHRSVRPFVCAQCGKSYRRKDVLTRHFQNCSPCSGSRGKTTATSTRRSIRRSCDRCVRQKKACSNSRPCSNCLSQNLNCTYPAETGTKTHWQDTVTSTASVDLPEDRGLQYPQEDFHSSMLGMVGHDQTQIPLSDAQSYVLMKRHTNEESMEAEGYTASDPDVSLHQVWQNIWLTSIDNASAVSTNRDPAVRFHFLINYAHNRDLTTTLELGKFAAETQQPSPTTTQRKMSDIDLTLSSDEVVLESNHQGQSQLAHDPPFDVAHSEGNPLPRVVDSKLLLLKTMEICKGLKSTIMNGPASSQSPMEWCSLTAAMAQQFFSPSNIRTFVGMYWTLWHPHWPCIHRPTFRYHTTPSNLLAVMVLAGASLSTQSQHRESASVWFDVVEEWIFNDPYVSSIGIGLDNQCLPRKDRQGKAQALQATFAILICQYQQGSEAAKGRVRRSRITTIVGIMRDIGISNAQHVYTNQLPNERFDWKEWVAREELIRLMTFTFAFDASFTTWHNTPPKLVIRELKIGLASPESCFQAQSAAQCQEKIKHWQSRFPPRVETLYSLICTFCQPKLSDDAKVFLPCCSLLSLWAVLRGLYIMGFILDTSILGSVAHFEPIVNGIENWKIVWNSRLSRGDDDEFDVPLADNIAGTVRSTARSGGQFLGFWRHAAEYWLLVRILVMRKIPADEIIGSAFSTTDVDLGWIFMPAPFDRYDQNACPNLLDFLKSGSTLST